MHNLKVLRDELIEEAETYKGSIKGGDPEDVACLKCLLSAADHADAIIDRHGIEDAEQEKSGQAKRRKGKTAAGTGDDRQNGMNAIILLVFSS